MSLISAMLGNAAIAAVLALFALILGWTCRSPHLRHVAWVLVLLKLVFPPLFPVPLAILPAAWSTPYETRSPQVSTIMALPIFPSSFSESDATSGSPSSLSGNPSLWSNLVTAAMGVWIIVSLSWFLWQGRRIWRFRRRIARAEAAAPEVAAVFQGLAQSLGISQPPVLKMAASIGSPMLWGWGRDAVVLFPRELWNRLAPQARDTLLAHELAHFLRRDHWVRVLEFFVTGLYWWHPAVWLARAGIEAAEEECCDAWVVGGLAASPRRYAEALLATIDFVAELQRPSLPPGACAANRSARLLRHRLLRLMHAQRPVPPRGILVVRWSALATLLVQPILCAATPDLGEPLPAPAIVQTPNAIPFSPTTQTHVVEPKAWALATAPGDLLTARACDNQVILRGPEGITVPLGPGKPIALAFAPDGKRLTTAGPGTLLRLWNERGILLSERHLSNKVISVAYIPDNTHLLALDSSGRITLHDPDTLTLLREWSLESPANSLACAPDNTTVAVSFGSWRDEGPGWVECWSIAQPRILARYQAAGPVGATRFAPDGSLLVLGSWNGMLTWRRFPGGEWIAERQLPKELVAATAFSPDARTLPLVPPPEPPSLAETDNPMLLDFLEVFRRMLPP